MTLLCPVCLCSFSTGTACRPPYRLVPADLTRYHSAPLSMAAQKEACEVTASLNIMQCNLHTCCGPTLNRGSCRRRCLLALLSHRAPQHITTTRNTPATPTSNPSPPASPNRNDERFSVSMASLPDRPPDTADLHRQSSANVDTICLKLRSIYHH